MLLSDKQRQTLLAVGTMKAIEASPEFPDVLNILRQDPCIIGTEHTFRKAFEALIATAFAEELNYIEGLTRSRRYGEALTRLSGSQISELTGMMAQLDSENREGLSSL